jgi:hypothetical protein
MNNNANYSSIKFKEYYSRWFLKNIGNIVENRGI